MGLNQALSWLWTQVHAKMPPVLPGGHGIYTAVSKPRVGVASHAGEVSVTKRVARVFLALSLALAAILFGTNIAR